MYIPKLYEVTDEPTLWAFMRQFNFALLISSDAAHVPFATPVPFTMDEGRRVLRTHIARANPQWRQLEPKREVLVVFQAEHALISPRWYESSPQVPTWNYATVHAYGRPRILEVTELRAQLEALMDHHAHADDMRNLPEEFVDRLQAGIVGIEVTVTRLEGKFKLSQNKSERDQRNVIDHLEAQGELERGVAARMKANLENTNLEAKS
jgi:transcriptional regulator